MMARWMLIAALMALPFCAARAVDVVTFEGWDYWKQGVEHMTSAEVDTINPAFTPARWWIQADSLDITVWYMPASGDTALSPVAPAMLVKSGEGLNFDTAVDWVKVKAESGGVGQVRFFFGGHSD